MDPRAFHRVPSRGEGRKTQQLCRQIERALNQLLPDCADDVLRDLLVQSVEPAPNASRLLVSVSSLAPEATPLEVIAHLQQAIGMLRGELASAIHRKRVPELAFRFMR